MRNESHLKVKKSKKVQHESAFLVKFNIKEVYLHNDFQLTI